MTITRRFQRTTEDFICGHCGAEVTGNGYTNHCPRCLWSRHVDVNPGDRAATCQGMMEPIGTELKKGEYIILHHCVACGFERKNKTMPEDSFDVIMELSIK